MLKLLLAALALASPFATRAAPAPNVQQHVNHLLGYIARSGCSFYRNGAWIDAAAAEAHARTRYDYLARNDEIASAADFIEKAAAQSSVTGLPYQVKCHGNPPVLARAWLREELARYQAGRS
jgi:Family of unknown function (DUF5329)